MSELVKYYGPDDMSFGYELNKGIKKFIDSEFKCESINDILELYNFTLFFDNEESYEVISQEIQIQYQKKYTTIISKYINSAKRELLIQCLKEVQNIYSGDFINLLSKYNKYGELEFLDIFDEIHINIILRDEKIVSYYEREIREEMMKESTLITYLIQEYSGYNKDKLYFPKCLSIKDKEKMVKEYLEGDYCNYNDLIKLKHLPRNKDAFLLSTEIEFLLEERIKREEVLISESSNSLNTKYGVIFRIDANVPKHEGLRINDDSSLSVSRDWLKEEQKYETLLNNFLYLFSFLDVEGRFLYLSKKTEESPITEAFSNFKSAHTYPQNVGTKLMEMMNLLILDGYYSFLASEKIRLEEVIEYFFEEYISSVHNIDNFFVRLPTKNSSYLEKCKSIMPEVESILKQFCDFVENDEINFDRINLMKGERPFHMIPSLNPIKYIYVNKSDADSCNIMESFFSSQSRLLYSNEKYYGNSQYSTFYDLVIGEKCYLNDYSENAKKVVMYFVDKGELRISDCGRVLFANKAKIFLLRDLYLNDVIGYGHIDHVLKLEIDRLIEAGVLYSESTLFSKPEVNYLNYMLNDKEYTNGYKLRNLYAHSNPGLGKDDKFHYTNYIRLLNITIIVMLKINDDFNIRYKDDLSIEG